MLFERERKRVNEKKQYIFNTKLLFAFFICYFLSAAASAAVAAAAAAVGVCDIFVLFSWLTGRKCVCVLWRNVICLLIVIVVHKTYLLLWLLVLLLLLHWNAAL